MIDHATLDYKHIKSWLRHGDIRDLAVAHNISKSHAYKILKGEVKHFDFMAAAMEVAIVNKSRFEALAARLTPNKTVNQ